MKKVLFVCLFVAGLSTVSLAQGGRRSPEEMTAALKTSLTLNDAQTAKVKAIYEAQGKSRDSLMQAANGDMQSAMPTMMKMRETTNAKIKAILTPEQATAFQKTVDEQAAAMRARMGN